jgi:hypothetical protein
MTCRVMLVLLAVLAGGCSSSKRDLTVPLTFRPERQVPGQHAAMAASKASRVFVGPVVDDRADKIRIGENTELSRTAARPIYSSGPSPAEFVGSVVSRERATAGLAAGDASQADRTLSMRLVRFFTAESTRYDTEVAMAAELRDKGGAPVWSGQVTGRSSRFGNSLNPENYNEGFSDATLEMVWQLLSDPGFRKAVALE